MVARARVAAIELNVAFERCAPLLLSFARVWACCRWPLALSVKEQNAEGGAARVAAVEGRVSVFVNRRAAGLTKTVRSRPERQPLRSERNLCDLCPCLFEVRIQVIPADWRFPGSGPAQGNVYSCDALTVN